MLRIFSYAYWPSVCLFWRNVYLGLLPTFFCLFVCFAVSVPIRFYSFHCIFPRKRKGREKGQQICYKMIANGKGSTWHSKISHQINTAQMGSPRPRGLCLLQFRNEKGWGKEQMGTCFSTLPPYKFKVSYKALVSSSKHGVTFAHLLLNNLVATLT